jgi:hypothetical protein
LIIGGISHQEHASESEIPGAFQAFADEIAAYSLTLVFRMNGDGAEAENFVSVPLFFLNSRFGVHDVADEKVLAAGDQIEFGNKGRRFSQLMNQEMLVASG